MRILIKYHFLAVWCVTLVLLLTSTQALATGAAVSKPNKPLSNQLADHPSPYLALHGDDPVAWQDWSPEVLERAKNENKLILLSSGYFSCHWCHVMQRESYQNPEVAEMLNNFFIPVKIDRELEPALDKRLMAYAQATLKRGGWPLNVFMSPDGLPVFAVLYQPQLQFLGLLTRLTGVWQQQSAHIRELALAEKKPLSFPDSDPVLDPSLITELRTLAVQDIMARGDDIQGGFGESNKFPSVPQLNFLLDSLAGHGNPEVVEFLHLTLSAMADNGMQDHLNGGFYRYVVDPAWEIPHFEKMLYDNANLAQLYLKAGQVLNEPNYTDIAQTTLDFLTREMANNQGILYASFSAVDDKDVEGGYYLWQTEQLKKLLNEREYRLFAEVWQTERPNDLEEGNHLRAAKPIKQAAESLQLSVAEALALLKSARQKLVSERNTRVLPTDDKLLAGWNALALSAFSIAAGTLDEAHYRTQAEKIKTFIMQKLWVDNQLRRSLAKGKLIGSASIEDYAYVARGLFDWAQLTAETKNYQLAELVLAQGWKRFYKSNVWSYADTSILPPAEGEEMLSENSSASPSATLIETTIALHNAGKLNDPALYNMALSALNRGEAELRRNSFWYVSQIGAMQRVIE